jgi:hypothetical protein
MHAAVILKRNGQPRIVLRIQASPAINPRTGVEVQLGSKLVYPARPVHRIPAANEDMAPQVYECKGLKP